jgi:hypothetical protein
VEEGDFAYDAEPDMLCVIELGKHHPPRIAAGPDSLPVRLHAEEQAG